jgi:hypothetical protein
MLPEMRLESRSGSPIGLVTDRRPAERGIYRPATLRSRRALEIRNARALLHVRIGGWEVRHRGAIGDKTSLNGNRLRVERSDYAGTTGRS